MCPSPRSEKLLKGAASIPRGSLVALGTCFGKFTKTQKFRLNVTALDFLAPYAKVRARSPPRPPPTPQHPPPVLSAVPLSQYKVWVKPGSEQSFLYGNHVLKSGLGRITENTAQYQGVVVYSMADVPLVSPAPPAARHGGQAAETSLFSLFFSSPGVWGSRQVDAGLPEGGPHGDRGVPPG